LIRILAHPVRIAAAALAGGACLTTPVLASVIPVGQSRQVSTFAFLDTGFAEQPLRSQETIESIDGGSFIEHAVCHVERDPRFVTALADQESTIGPDGVSATLSASAEHELAMPVREARALASSGLVYEFDVDVPTEVRLTASVFAENDGVIDIAIRVRLGAEVVGWQFFDTQEELEHLELLPPGAYQLEVGGGGEVVSAFPGSRTSSIALEFEMTYPSIVGVSSPIPPVTRPIVYPNPARDAVTVSLPDFARGPVGVFDPSGRLLRVIDTTSGTPVVWDTRDTHGAAVQPGIYFLRWDGGQGTSVAIFR